MPAPLTVSAAISLTDALEEAGRAYRAAGGGEVRFNFGGSNVLARQILNGAPVDLFVSADEAQMKLIEAAGAIASDSRVDLLGNKLAVVLSSSAPAVKDAEGLAQPGIRRMPRSDAVPAGVREAVSPVGRCVGSAAVEDRSSGKRARRADGGGARAVEAAISDESDLAAARRAASRSWSPVQPLLASSTLGPYSPGRRTVGRPNGFSRSFEATRAPPSSKRFRFEPIAGPH